MAGERQANVTCPLSSAGHCPHSRRRVNDHGRSVGVHPGPPVTSPWLPSVGLVTDLVTAGASRATIEKDYHVKPSTVRRRLAPVAVVLSASFALTACGGSEPSANQEAPVPGAENTGDSDAGGEGGELSGAIAIDGSSTVGPLTDAITEEYAAVEPGVTVNLGISGTGGGFERFCGVGDTQISNASRPITEDEVALCEENGVEYTEVRVGTDALTMVVNPSSDFVTCLTTDEVVSIWGPEGVDSWDQVNPEFPAEPLEVFAPGVDSGTYDFFNETILEPNDIEAPRQDYNASEDDNIIAQGIQGTPGAWGYFGYAYYQENTDTLTALEYDAGEGCVAPSVETAQDDSYKLSRPLFIYVRNDALADPHVADFVTFYLDTVNEVVESVGYIPATEEAIAESQATVEAAIETAG
jgi:phosphate transport system substrate-binding protein